MKKPYISPETELTKVLPVQFFCASEPGTVVDGPEGPTGPVTNDDEEESEDDALGKHFNLWDDWN